MAMVSNGVRWPVAVVPTLATNGVVASATFYARPLMHERLLEFPTIVALYVSLVGAYLAPAPFQFVRRIRSRWPGFHRRTGRLLVAISLVTGVSGLLMAWVIPFAGWPERAIPGFFGLPFPVAIVSGSRYIPAGRTTTHRDHGPPRVDDSGVRDLPDDRDAVGFRLLARNLAIGVQIKGADARPAVIREPAAFRAAHVDSLGTFALDGRTILLTRPRPGPAATFPLPWTDRVVRLVARPEL